MHDKRRKLEERDILGRPVHSKDDDDTFITKVNQPTDNVQGDYCVRPPKVDDKFKIYFD